jgi:Na+/proline symporter
MLNPIYISLFIAFYFLMLLSISWVTARNADQDSYFLGNKSSKWYLVAFGMIGDSLSGVTFISVPGIIAADKFNYLQLVLGYVLGYFFIGKVLLPLYYSKNLTSIYTYLHERFGYWSEKTGSFYFLISRLLGAGARLYLAINVLQIFVFNQFNIPFYFSALIVIVLILFYTVRGGIKTLVWTDVFQSSFLLMAVVFTMITIANQLDLGVGGLLTTLIDSDYTKVFHWDLFPKSFFPKQFIGGALIAITMTGLDQNMMQKNLSCKTLPEAQKNIYSFSFIQLAVNLFFLSLGVLLYEFAVAKGISLPAKSDEIFPFLALHHLGWFAAIVFIVGLTAATFNSADSVLTTLTTSFYFDFLDKKDQGESNRKLIHIAFAILLLLVIMIFKWLNNSAVISTVLFIAGITYGPLLGLFMFGILTSRKVKDNFVPFICIIAPAISYVLSELSKINKDGYQIGNELLLINGLLTFLGIWLISYKDTSKK